MNAKEIILLAEQCQVEGRLVEAQDLYYDGIEIVKNLVANLKDSSKQKKYNKHIQLLHECKENLKRLIHNNDGSPIENLFIPEGSTGYSYNTLFGKYLNKDVKEVLIEDPYLNKNFKYTNLVVFLELIIKKCIFIKYIRLVTKRDSASDNQNDVLNSLRECLAKRNIQFRFHFKKNLQHRKIFLSNGYIIKIDRGLDIYKSPSPLYSIGLNDFHFRKCRKTDITIIKSV